LSWEDNPGFSEWENNHKGPYWKDARRRSAEEKKEITLGGGERKPWNPSLNLLKKGSPIDTLILGF
jgi:hypothetical protein